jgi:SHS2 domain-containing protein
VAAVAAVEEAPASARVGFAESELADRPTYREIEHTADVGVELEAPDLRSAFELAAACMFDLISDLDSVGESTTRRVRAEGAEGDLENLMLRWLSELLYLFESEGLLLCSFRVSELSAGAVTADVAGEPYDAARHTLKAELKAPTYHRMAVEQAGDVWRVRIIFDT